MKRDLAIRLMASGMLLSLLSAGCAVSALPTPPTPTAPAALPTPAPEMTPSATATMTAVPSPVPTPTASPSPTCTPTSTPVPDIAAAPTVTLTVVYDNHAYTAGLGTDWGFACIIERGPTTLLFDTGADGTLLLRNLAELGYAPQAIDVVVLSHAHQDHTGGLTALLDAGAAPVVYVPSTFASTFKQQVQARASLIEVDGPGEILPGFISTGPLGARISEQALAVETPPGLVVITGCAHPGVAQLTQLAATYTHSTAVELVLGGFHLGNASFSEVEAIIAAFRDFGVRRVAPCHCTGASAQQHFATAYGTDYLAVGVGWTRVLREP